MNPTIRLDDRIVKSIKANRSSTKLGEGSMISLVSEAVRLFSGKSPSCFSCDAHKAVLVGIELAKQKAALMALGKPTKSGNMWTGIPSKELSIAKDLSRNYGGSSRAVVEQAVIEHIGRPDTCDACPYYDKMCLQAKVQNRRA